MRENEWENGLSEQTDSLERIRLSKYKREDRLDEQMDQNESDYSVLHNEIENSSTYSELIGISNITYDRTVKDYTVNNDVIIPYRFRT